MWSEFRFAARSLARWRGGFAVAVVTLAIGIGTATALYALTRVLIPDLPGVPRVDRLARVYASNQALEVDRSPVTLTEFDSTVSKATSFAGLGAYADVDATLGMGSTVRPIIAGYASPGFFTAMGVPPLAGRVFAASDLADGDRPARGRGRPRPALPGGAPPPGYPPPPLGAPEIPRGPGGGAPR